MEKTKVIVLLVFVLLSSAALAQKIEMYKTFGGVQYMRSDTVLSERQVSMLMYKDNPAAYQEFRKAKRYSVVSSIMGFSGGALIAVPLVTAVAGGEPEWAFAAGGAALLLGSIPFNRIYKARSLNAIDIYNEKKTGRIKTDLYFYGSAAKVVIRF